MRTTPENAQLALLLEVTGTPKPGNVDREHDYPDLRFEHFMAGAVGAGAGLRMAAGDASLGAAFERAVAGMAHQTAGNTQFGALLALCPLVRASANGDLTSEGVTSVVEHTTVADAAGFYRAFEHVAVAVDDPPADLEALDVRRGADAIPALEERALTLADVMERSAPVDGVAREWIGGFERSFRVAEQVLHDDGPVPDRAARAFLDALAAEPDTFIEKQHDAATAREATERARAVLDGDGDTIDFDTADSDTTDSDTTGSDANTDASGDPAALADAFVAAGINPGTTADIVAAGLFIALERGLSV